MSRIPQMCLRGRPHDFSNKAESGWCANGCGWRDDGRRIDRTGEVIEPGPYEDATPPRPANRMRDYSPSRPARTAHVPDDVQRLRDRYGSNIPGRPTVQQEFGWGSDRAARAIAAARS